MDGKTVLENYRLNKAMLQKIKPQKIEIIILAHNHQDHIGLVPALFATGKCNARIIVPNKSTAILKEMWQDCAYINERDAEYLTQKTEKYVEPLYTEEDVNRVMRYIEEYPSNEIVCLDDVLSMKYTPAGHIFLSQQTEVFLNNGSHKSILFTSDLGNVITSSEHIFVEDFQSVKKANIVIGECTYSAQDRDITRKNVDTDFQKLESIVRQFCIDSKHRVLIPSFALDRTPYILWMLYSIFGGDEKFDVPILVDSPLAIRLLHHYSRLLTGEAKECFDEMMSWKNIRLVNEPEDSKAAVDSKKSAVILASSGMITAGRSVKWLKSILPNENDCILIVGYMAENSLGWKIKHGESQKTITVQGKPYRNNAQIYNLTSCSSHMQRSDLLKYYSDITADRIYLVHSDKNKISFKEDLELEIQKKLKTTKVIMPNKSTRITI